VKALSCLVAGWMLLGAGVSAQEIASDSAKPEVAVASEMATARPAKARCSPEDHLRPECRFKFEKAFAQSFLFMSFEHLGNLPTYRPEGPFIRNYFRAVHHQRFSRWSDDDPFIVDYVGHPMSGATYGFIFLQNDPQYAGMGFSNSRPYWMSRAKAMSWAAVWSAEWEIGPFSEASFGPLGKDKYWSKTAHKYTNGTGMVDFVMTPVGGAAWMVGEDLMDKYVIQRAAARTQNRFALFGLSVLNPNRSVANLMRFKAPWYRERVSDAK
jgi:hypothetical protein